MLAAVKSLYMSVTSCVRLNNVNTNWFNVNTGLRQGCSLSPLLFNRFINDLALRIKAMGKGVHVDNEHISILLYADDIVLIAENETDLQYMLNELDNWCTSNCMQVNTTKSNVVHFRPVAISKTNCVFRCGNNIIDIIDKYVYLGIVLTEYLDFNITAKIVA